MTKRRENARAGEGSRNHSPMQRSGDQPSAEAGAERAWSYTRPVVFAGHPGHELKILGWLAERRPRVHVLTDGSGGAGVPRLAATSELLSRVGARAGEVFAPLSDADIYHAILEQKLTLFCSIVDQLADSLADHGADFVAADASEGFNPTHDICRQMANAAIYRAQRMTGRAIANYEFLLTEWDLGGPASDEAIRDRVHDPAHDYRCWHLRLGDRSLRLKLDAARNYAELRAEVDQAIALKGEEYFRIECFRKVTSPFVEYRQGYTPYYEQLGERRVAAGKYFSAIRYENHMAPLLRGIRDYAIRYPRPCEVGAPRIDGMKAVS